MLTSPDLVLRCLSSCLPLLRSRGPLLSASLKPRSISRCLTTGNIQCEEKCKVGHGIQPRRSETPRASFEPQRREWYANVLLLETSRRIAGSLYALQADTLDRRFGTSVPGYARALHDSSIAYVDDRVSRLSRLARAPAARRQTTPRQAFKIRRSMADMQEIGAEERKREMAQRKDKMQRINSALGAHQKSKVLKSRARILNGRKHLEGNERRAPDAQTLGGWQTFNSFRRTNKYVLVDARSSSQKAKISYEEFPDTELHQKTWPIQSAGQDHVSKADSKGSEPARIFRQSMTQSNRTRDANVHTEPSALSNGSRASSESVLLRTVKRAARRRALHERRSRERWPALKEIDSVRHQGIPASEPSEASLLVQAETGSSHDRLSTISTRSDVPKSRRDPAPNKDSKAHRQKDDPNSLLGDLAAQANNTRTVKLSDSERALTNNEAWSPLTMRKNHLRPARERNLDPQSEQFRRVDSKHEPMLEKQQAITELNEQEIEAFRKIAEDNISLMPLSAVDSTRDTAKTSAGAISILEELFPRELSRSSEQQKAKRHIPRASLGTISRSKTNPSTVSEEETDYTDTDTGTQIRERQASRVRRVSQHDDGPALLILKKASKNLTEDDFRGVAPGSQHITGWFEFSSIEQIVRGRDALTLQRTGEYFLIFSSSLAARTYYEHVAKLHRSSKLHTPRTMYSPLPPAPELGDGGKPVWKDAVYQYTLKPPSHDLVMRMSTPPFSPILRDIVDKKGYVELMHGRTTDFEVLLWLEGWNFCPPSVIRQVLNLDGKMRGSHWTASAMGQTGIRVLADRFREGSVPRVEESLDREQRSDDELVDVPKSTLERPRYFVLAFRDEAEAQRFVMLWHRRDTTELMQGFERSGGEQIIANAEIVW